MPEALTYPGAKWTPLGAQTETRMTGHDILCLHTMVGYLVSTDRYFRISNGTAFSGTESHYGVGGKWGPDLGGGLDGAVWQWQDRAFQADANLNGGPRVISIETADNAPALPEDIAPWTPKQCEAIARLLAWESTPAAHAKCPSTWTCHKVGIPLELIPDTKPGRRGVGYHRQGIEPWLVDGGVKWSASYGKACPTPKRIAQIPAIITRAKAIRAGATNPPEDPVTVEEMDTLITRLLARKLDNGTSFGGNVQESADRIEVIYGRTGTLVEGGGINTQLDEMHSTLSDEDLQTDRIETALTKLGDIPALAAAIAADLPPGADAQAAAEAGIRAVLGKLDEAGA